MRDCDEHEIDALIARAEKLGVSLDYLVRLERQDSKSDGGNISSRPR